jgi:UDP-N-acetyl-D-mannosaminuronic acid dehydrogenase/UDP-N-acetyl-D-glucosamine dehydrogenase
VVIGQGYVGLPISVAAVKVGFDVVGLETDTIRCEQLQAASSYVEDIPSRLLADCLATGRFLPSSSIEDCADFDVAVITVPTPLSEDLPDLSFVEGAARSLAPLLRPGAAVILESTTYPGTTEELVVPILEEGSGLRAGLDFHVGYSPERIDPGNPVWHLENTPKVVSGIDAASLKAVRSFYDSFVETTVPVSGTREAELTKLLENTFRHVNIALINELTMFAAEMDIDVWESIAAADSKPFGFMRFTPGPGVGGHCLPIDPSYLSWKVKRTLGKPFRFIELANDVNNHMPDYVCGRVAAILNHRARAVRGSRVLILGLAYKRNTGDIREAPGPMICAQLTALGAEVRAADPHVAAIRFPEGVAVVELSAAELAAADLVVVVTDHDDFDWQLVQEAVTPVLDTRHCLEPADRVHFL